ncbi:MAG: tetratricopeptide repeat protein [Rhodothermales bacterium]
MRLTPLILLLGLVWPAVSATAQQADPPGSLSSSVLSDPELNRDASQALEDLYNMRFDRAEAAADRIRDRHPGHPVGPFLDGLIVWWKILPNLTVEDHSHDRAFFRAMQETIDRAEQLRKSRTYGYDADFFQGAAHGFRGRLHGDRESWLKGAQDGRRALDFVLDLAQRDTSNADLLFGEGVYRYFAEAIPEQYPIVRPIMFFFPDGDKEDGKRLLRTVVRRGTYVRAEAAWFLLQIHMAFEPDYERALEYATLLNTWYPENPLFQAMLGRVLFRWGQWDRAETTFRALIPVEGADTNDMAPSPPFASVPPAVLSQAHYYLGRIEMTRRNWPAARVHFEQVPVLEAPYDGHSWFKVHALLRTAMTLDAQGQRAEAETAYRAVLKLPERGGSRDRARNYLETPYRMAQP